MPQLRPAHRPVCFPVTKTFQLPPPLLRGAHEHYLIMVGDGAIDNGLVEARLGDEERRQFVGDPQQVAKPPRIVSRGNAVVTHPVVIEARIDDLDLRGMIASHRRKEVVLVEDAFPETQPLLQQERTLVRPQHHANKGKVAVQQGVLAVIVHAVCKRLLGQEVGLVKLARRLPITAAREAEQILILQRFGDGFQGIVFQPVVAVQEKDVISFCRIHPRIAGRRKAGIGLPYDPQPLVLGRIIVQYRRRAIGRAVIYADGLPVGKGLVEDAVKAIAKISLNVIDGDDDGEAHCYC